MYPNPAHAPRQDARHVIGRFVAPATQAGALEGFMVVDLSAEGMSVLRVARKPGPDRQQPPMQGLDHQFCRIAVPLPERGTHVSALVEVMHRKRFGPLELIGLRFQQMAATDRAVLVDYLQERDHLSFGARHLRQ
jgi:hypothetical protein